MNNLTLKNKNFYKEIKLYILGFLFSLFLTLIPFFLVFKNYFSSNITIKLIIIFSCIQIFVHLKYFLHLNFSKKNYWNIIFLIFSILVIFIIIFGSIWIMYHLNNHMKC
ncbi:cytochrome o ubiquinol oxidase subunit IV [Buchnera aphidicola]|uniref:Cytochrome bo(3) ubiquinol oxidase subunit 4 n=1 Tax=Buchnera aphidicola (Therioaphis trifolii) TaxID=1241884 RepID=A0A4D6YDJ1_9GAMM|nr:cytochrome o ubiquinol oxidase subunit IV [Buchnera aphidicola]QCI27289.1 cytochrome o ubiquinol oxidase subunit IV [Buchnera aphidicola (Therioaphis trifolii)]